MAPKERITFQPDMPGRGAKLVLGQAVVCRRPDEMHRRAEKALTGGRVVGAHIIRVLGDESFGEYGEPDDLAAVGRVKVSEMRGGDSSVRRIR